MKNKILFVITCLLLNSCVIPLTDEQLRIIDCVNVGDTLIFRADNGKRDTMVITEKKIYLQELNPIFGNTWYRPQNAVVRFYNTDRKALNLSNELVPSIQDLIHIRGGRMPSDSAKITINIRSFMCFMSETRNNLGEEIFKPIEINGEIYSGYFIRTSINPDKNRDCSIEKLYWHFGKGPLMYVDVNNQKWERIR